MKAKALLNIRKNKVVNHSQKRSREWPHSYSDPRYLSSYVSSYVFSGSIMGSNVHNSSRMKKTRRLIALRWFQVINTKDFEGHHIYRTRFVNKLESDRTKRSTRCVAACIHKGEELFTTVGTMKRNFLRLPTSMSTSDFFAIQTSYITNAFVMSSTLVRGQNIWSLQGRSGY